MIRIEVVNTAVDDRTVTSKSGDKSWQFRDQGAYAFIEDRDGRMPKYPVNCRIPLEKDQPPYPAGFYTLDPRSIYVGDFGKLEIGRVRLLPERKAA